MVVGLFLKIFKKKGLRYSPSHIKSVIPTDRVSNSSCLVGIKEEEEEYEEERYISELSNYVAVTTG